MGFSHPARWPADFQGFLPGFGAPSSNRVPARRAVSKEPPGSRATSRRACSRRFRRLRSKTSIYPSCILGRNRPSLTPHRRPGSAPPRISAFVSVLVIEGVTAASVLSHVTSRTAALGVRVIFEQLTAFRTRSLLLSGTWRLPRRLPCCIGFLVPPQRVENDAG